jgi:putative ABC transport system permease protein
MFKKILKKDFKRKKAMNIILFIFMLTASTLIAGSSNLLYSTITAVDYFIDKSEVANLISVTSSEPEVVDAITQWADNSKAVKKYQGEEVTKIDEKKVTASTGKTVSNIGAFVISAKPAKYNLIFDKDGKDFDVKPSEIAVPVSIQKKMELSIGDRMSIEINGYRQDFIVSCIFKDAVLGAELMGMKRLILNQADFDALSEHAIEPEHLKFWGFSKENGYSNSDLENEFADLSVPTYTILSKDLIKTAYVLDTVLAAIMIIVSIFLILISFLILRFTIVFTVMEDYKQIGVMKAIGMLHSLRMSATIVKILSVVTPPESAR